MRGIRGAAVPVSLGQPCLPPLLGPRVPGGPSARRRAVMVLGSLLSSGRRLSTCHFKGLSRELLIRCCELQRKRGRTLLGPRKGRWCQRQRHRQHRFTQGDGNQALGEQLSLSDELVQAEYSLVGWREVLGAAELPGVHSLLQAFSSPTRYQVFTEKTRQSPKKCRLCCRSRRIQQSFGKEEKPYQTLPLSSVEQKCYSWG